MKLDLDKNKIKSGLYIVSTPIGNLGDITLRALQILDCSDYILCEDTRIARKILNYHKINTSLISNHKFNEKSNVEKIIKLIKSGKIISLISDAGTPLISDPGNIILKECIINKLNVAMIYYLQYGSFFTICNKMTLQYEILGYIYCKSFSIEKKKRGAEVGS